MDTTSPPPAGRAISPGTLPGLAIASLVLGILGSALSVVLVGAFLALVGLVLGAIHLVRRRDSRRMAWSGVGLSLVGVVASIGFFAVYASGLHRLAGAARGGGGGGMSFDDWQGKMAPEFELALLDGTQFRLADQRGKRVVLDFWATWCPPCVREIPHFAQLHREISTNDLVIVGISQEDRAVLKPFVTAKDIPYGIASSANTALPEPYSGVTAIPTTFFLDRQGRIQQVVVGYHDYEGLHRMATADDLDAPSEVTTP